MTCKNFLVIFHHYLWCLECYYIQRQYDVKSNDPDYSAHYLCHRSEKSKSNSNKEEYNEGGNWWFSPHSVNTWSPMVPTHRLWHIWAPCDLENKGKVAKVNQLMALASSVISSKMKRIAQMLHFRLSILVKCFLTERVSELPKYAGSRPQCDKSKHCGKNNQQLHSFNVYLIPHATFTYCIMYMLLQQAIVCVQFTTTIATYNKDIGKVCNYSCQH